jgi:hypothetical protein
MHNRLYIVEEQDRDIPEYIQKPTTSKPFLRPKLITYLQPLIEVNPMSMFIHMSIFYLRPYNYKSQLAMWIHYWHTQTQIWIETATTVG